MEPRLVLHIVDADSRSRAEQARTAFALGHHAEVYSDVAELLGRPPGFGVILVRQAEGDPPLGELFDRLGEAGVWLPVIVCTRDPQLERVVATIKAGALDCLQLPLEAGRLARSLARVVAEAEADGLARRRVAEARRRVGKLSKRERQVLELLSLGSSNKIIARELAISPRTVEIHRANMMTKLRANHSAEAVRVWLQSGLETTVPEPVREDEITPERGLARYPDYIRLLRERLPDVIDDAEPGSGEPDSEGEAGGRTNKHGSRRAR